MWKVASLLVGISFLTPVAICHWIENRRPPRELEILGKMEVGQSRHKTLVVRSVEDGRVTDLGVDNVTYFQAEVGSRVWLSVPEWRMDRQSAPWWFFPIGTFGIAAMIVPMILWLVDAIERDFEKQFKRHESPATGPRVVHAVVSPMDIDCEIRSGVLHVGHAKKSP